MATFWQKIKANTYSILAPTVRMFCLRLYGPQKLPNLYTHHWTSIQRPGQIKNGEYIVNVGWVFACQECGLRMGKGVIPLSSEYHTVYGRWLKDQNGTVYWAGAASIEYTETCREHAIKSVLT